MIDQQITFLSIPKPFTGRNRLPQSNAILSWMSLVSSEHIYLCGDDEGIREMCNELEVNHIGSIRKNDRGTPLLNNVFEKVQEISHDRIFVFINTDIILTGNVLETIKRVNARFDNFLIVGHRYDVGIESSLDPGSKKARGRIAKIVDEQAFIQRPSYKDFFIFTRGLWRDMPGFAVGRASYDNALVHKAIKDGIPVIDGSNQITAIHQNHDYGHLVRGKDEAYKGEEARKNYALSEKWTGDNVVGKGYISHATWYIDTNGAVKKNTHKRDDTFARAQKLFFRLQSLGWNNKYDAYVKNFVYVKNIKPPVTSPRISIIVVSWRYHPDTIKNFKILEQQRGQKYELIFVNNGAADEGFEGLEPFIDTYIKLNKNTGPCFARNVGSVFARAPILCFLEDDGIPDEYFVKAHLGAYEKYNIIGLAGVYRPKTNNPLNKLAQHYYRGPEPFPFLINLEGNSSVVAKYFYAVGGWDEDIFIMADGLALSLRLLKIEPDMKKQIYYPEAVIYHDYAVDEEHLKRKHLQREKSLSIIREKYKNCDSMLESWRSFAGRKDLVPSYDINFLWKCLDEKKWNHKKCLYAACLDSVCMPTVQLSPLVSIIVISWRFHPDVVRNFETLKKQRNLKVELIFVSNGGKEDEFNSLRQYVNTYVRLNSNVGAYMARNIGAVFAKAPILIFLEDDGIVADNFVAAHIANHRAYDIVACRGVSLPKTHNPLNAQQEHYCLGVVPFPRFADLEGNVSYRADIFYQVGGWDDKIIFGGGGVELSRRLVDVEPDRRKQIYSPDPVIYHDYAASDEHLVTKRLRQKQSFAYIELKHPDYPVFERSWDAYKGCSEALIKRCATMSRSERPRSVRRRTDTVVTYMITQPDIIALCDQGHWKRAEATARKLFSADRNESKALYTVASKLKEHAHIKKARALFQEIVKTVYPTDSIILGLSFFKLAEIHQEQRQVMKARACLEKCLFYYPTHSKARCMLSDLKTK